MAVAIDDCGKPFRILTTRNVLRANQKCIPGDEDKSDGADAEDENKCVSILDERCDPDTRVVSESSSCRQGRPVGRSSAKNREAKMELQAKKLKLADASSYSVNARNKVLVRHNEILLFTKVPSGPSSTESTVFQTSSPRDVEETEKAFA